MKLSFREKASYGVGALGKDMACGIVNTFLMFYFTDVVGLAPAFLGVLFMAARIWDAVNDPMAGWLVDNTRGRLGKFRPWILAGTLSNTVVLLALFSNPDVRGAGQYVFYSVVYILWGMTYTLEDIAYWSMIPALADDEGERNTISVIPRVFAAVGNIAVGSLGLALVSKLGGVAPDAMPTPEQQSRGFFWLAALIGAVFVVTNVVTVLFVKEKVVVPSDRKFKFKEIFTTIAGNDQLLVIIVAMTLYTLAINLTASLGLYWFKYDVGDEGLYGTFYLTAAAQVLAMVVFPAFAKWFSRRRVFILSAALPIVGYVSLYVIGKTTGDGIALMAVAGVVLFFGFGFSLVLTSVMLADAVDYGEWKLGVRSESIVFSMQTFMVKFAMALSGLVTGVGLAAFGFVANAAQSASAVTGIRVLMFAVPMALIVASLVVYLKGYRLNGEYFETVKAELEERRIRHA
ncbi:MAG: melibiose:sodium transporter MelB [Spirochaetaceae bacterium]|nr:melibiose:sodium transporter MelB [Spirochaetaceae bacterium]HPE88043.1 melibiose:sodium transporter MelB [Spirochaetales bacterium]